MTLEFHLSSSEDFRTMTVKQLMLRLHQFNNVFAEDMKIRAALAGAKM